MDLPGQGQFELVHQIGELVFDLEWSMPLTCKFRGRLISGKVRHLKPNGRSHCKAWVITLPFVINSLQYFLRPLNSTLAFLLSLMDPLNSFIQVGGLSGIWNVCKHRRERERDLYFSMVTGTHYGTKTPPGQQPANLCAGGREVIYLHGFQVWSLSRYAVRFSMRWYVSRWS